MNQAIYLSLLAQARRTSRRANEAEDLLQSALLAALSAGRADLSDPQNRRWLTGVLRNRAAFDARTAVRRRARDVHAVPKQVTPPPPPVPARFFEGLPPALRTTGLLAITGHTKAEIAYLLRLPDTALRQRIAQIKQRWRLFAKDEGYSLPDLQGTLSYGVIRHALHRHIRRSGAVLGSHDPDGHLFMLSGAHKSAVHGNTDI